MLNLALLYLLSICVATVEHNTMGYELLNFILLHINSECLTFVMYLYVCLLILLFFTAHISTWKMHLLCVEYFRLSEQKIKAATE